MKIPRLGVRRQHYRVAWTDHRVGIFQEDVERASSAPCSLGREPFEPRTQAIEAVDGPTDVTSCRAARGAPEDGDPGGETRRPAGTAARPPRQPAGSVSIVD